MQRREPELIQNFINIAVKNKSAQNTRIIATLSDDADSFA